MVSVAAEQTLHNAALQPQVQGALLLAGIGLLGFLSAAFARILNKVSTHTHTHTHHKRPLLPSATARL